MSIKFGAFFLEIRTFAGRFNVPAWLRARPTNDLTIRDFRPYSGPWAEWSHLVVTKSDDGTRGRQIDVLVEERDERTQPKARPSRAGKSLAGVGN
jgi:hypothetical protein